MNFYKRFMGDIQKKTGHLSLAEFGAYDRLLDHYYSTEQALPQDLDACCRIARAMVKEERKAVQSVLAQFFICTDAGFTQSRADEMIAEAQPKMEANRSNGLKGGRPRKIPKPSEEKPTGLLNKNPDQSQTEANDNLSQNQSQISSSLRSEERSARASRLPPDFELPEVWRAWCVQNRPDLKAEEVFAKFRDYWSAKPGKAGTKLDWLATWRNWCREEKSLLNSAAETAYQRSMRERFAEVAPAVARKAPGGYVNPVTFFENLARSEAQTLEITP